MECKKYKPNHAYLSLHTGSKIEIIAHHTFYLLFRAMAPRDGVVAGKHKIYYLYTRPCMVS